jgi:putative GTP pyrophosphokinase
LLLSEYRRFKDLKVEIQIRSILQHAWAEIEHDLGYKSKYSVPRLVRRDFSRLAGLLELADEEFVKIRNNLEEYNETIPEKIKNTPSNVLIDKITIQKLLENSETINNILDFEIAKIVSADIDVPTPTQIENHVQRLKYLGLNTVEEILSSLQRYRDQILKLANRFLILSVEVEGEYDTFSRGISLFYLAYAIVGSEKSVEEIKDYLKTFTIGESTNYYEFAEKIKSLCE